MDLIKLNFVKHLEIEIVVGNMRTCHVAWVPINAQISKNK